MTITIGIDISKLKFDATFLDSDNIQTYRTFDNNQAGFEAFCRDLRNPAETRVALEATGVYGESLCQFLYDLGCTVYLLNPASTQFYSKSMLRRCKTDKSDGALIAQFLNHHTHELKAWHPKSEEQQHLQRLQGCLDDLQADRLRVLGRLEGCHHACGFGRHEVTLHYRDQLVFLDQKILAIEQEMLTIVKIHSELRERFVTLISIEGIGEKTALGLLAYLPDLMYFKTAKSLSAFAGLNPSVKQSGSSVRGKGNISKMGAKKLRTLLYMPAVVAKRHNKVLKPFADSLIERGKPKKVVTVAVMRKLLHYIFAVLKKGKGDPSKAH